MNEYYIDLDLCEINYLLIGLSRLKCEIEYKINKTKFINNNKLNYDHGFLLVNNNNIDILINKLLDYNNSCFNYTQVELIGDALVEIKEHYKEVFKKDIHKNISNKIITIIGV